MTKINADLFETFLDTAYNGVEVSPVRKYEEDDTTYCEVCKPDEADFWSVYLHRVSGGVECVADLPTEIEANALGDLLKAAMNLHIN